MMVNHAFCICTQARLTMKLGFLRCMYGSAQTQQFTACSNTPLNIIGDFYAHHK